MYEAFNWRHGVFVGSAMRSESTAAAEHKGESFLGQPHNVLILMTPWSEFCGVSCWGKWGSWQSGCSPLPPATPVLNFQAQCSKVQPA